MHTVRRPLDDLAGSASRRAAAPSPRPTSSPSPALTGDFHPQHVDAEWAAESPFGERIAHGLLVLSYAAGLVPFDPERVDRAAPRPRRRLQAPRAPRRHDPRRGPGRRGRARRRRPASSPSRWPSAARTTGRSLRAVVEVLWRRDAPRPSPLRTTCRRSRSPAWSTPACRCDAARRQAASSSRAR